MIEGLRKTPGETTEMTTKKPLRETTNVPAQLTCAGNTTIVCHAVVTVSPKDKQTCKSVTKEVFQHPSKLHSNLFS